MKGGVYRMLTYDCIAVVFIENRNLIRTILTNNHIPKFEG